MISNIVGHASAPEVTDAMKKRVVEYWTNIHKDLGHGVSQGLALS
jgi:catalase